MTNQTDPLLSYIEAWREHDVAGVLATLAEDCVVVESHGPVYRGHERVAWWMREWFREGGSVDAWEVTSQAAAGEVLVIEWSFSCTWKGVSHTFEGATVARLRDGTDGKIAYLREYATTAPLYDGAGVWRD
jgi:ketosteroid isomerase-like protein